MRGIKTNRQTSGKEEGTGRQQSKPLSGRSCLRLPKQGNDETDAGRKRPTQLQNREGIYGVDAGQCEGERLRTQTRTGHRDSRQQRKRAGRSLLMLGWLLCCLLWVAASPVSGHAYVTTANPESGERLEHMPKEVSITFNERLENSLFELAVLDEHGRNVAARPKLNEKRVTLSAELTTDKDGLYTVNYRVISLDGHPVGGTYVFAVGAEAGVAIQEGANSAAGQGTKDALASDQGKGSLSAVRGAYLGGLLFLTGGVWWRRQGMTVPLRPRLLSAAILLLYIWMFSLQYGSWLMSQEAGNVAAFAVSSAGWPWVLQALLLLAGLWLSTWRGGIAMLWACALLAVESIQGHAARGAAGMGILADFVHLGAAALWAAGLTGLLWSLLKERSRWRERAMRFSRTAVWSMVLLTISGLVQGVLIWGGRWEELPYTPWGRLALGKVVLTAAVVLTASSLWVLMRKRMQRTTLGVFTIDLLLMCMLVGTAAAMSFQSPAPMKEMLHWHMMEEQVHILVHMEPKELGENKAVLTVWADREVPLPEQVQLQLVHKDREELQALEIPLQQVESAESDGASEGSVHTHQYKTEEALIPMIGRWEAVLHLTYETGDTHTYRKEFRVFSK